PWHALVGPVVVAHHREGQHPSDGQLRGVGPVGSGDDIRDDLIVVHAGRSEFSCREVNSSQGSRSMDSWVSSWRFAWSHRSWTHRRWSSLAAQLKLATASCGEAIWASPWQRKGEPVWSVAMLG